MGVDFSLSELFMKSTASATQQRFMRHRFLRSMEALAPILAVSSILFAVANMLQFGDTNLSISQSVQLIGMLVFILVSTYTLLDICHKQSLVRVFTAITTIYFVFELLTLLHDLFRAHVGISFHELLQSKFADSTLIAALLLISAFFLYLYKRSRLSQMLLIAVILMPVCNMLAILYKVPEAYGQLPLMACVSGVLCAFALLARQIAHAPLSYLFLLDESGSQLRLRIISFFFCANVLGYLGILANNDPRFTPGLITLAMIIIVAVMTLTYYQKGVMHENVLPPSDLSFASQLEAAIAREEFYLVYQPQFDIASGRIVGVEALIRWQHPELGLVPPNRFIGIAELTGLIVPMGSWVLRQACKDVASWHEDGLGGIKVSVNVSSHQLNTSDFIDNILQVLEETGLPSSQLVVELTESSFIHTDVQNLRVMQQLKQAGIKLAIDDFGTGYSCLAYLRDIPGDFLKVDRSFVCELPGKERSEAVIRAIIALGKSLDYTIIAEGVETEAQARLLSTLGCDLVQGFLYAKPMKEVDLKSWAKENVKSLPG